MDINDHKRRYFLDGYTDKDINPTKNNNIKSILTPHAGLRYVGSMLNDIYGQINWELIDDVIMLSTNHNNNENYQPKSNKFTNGNTVYNLRNRLNIKASDEVFLNEHSWLVQMPFIDNTKPITIVLVGTYDKELATKINGMITNRTLLITNTDLHHCGSNYNNICKDHHNFNRDTMNKIINKDKDLKERMCGSQAVLTMLDIIETRNWYVLNKFYTASDIIEPGSNSSVGYCYMAYVDRNIKMLDIPRTILNFIDGFNDGVNRDEVGQIISDFFREFNVIDKISKRYGIFVTIENNGQLRGCIGRFTSNTSTERLIAEMTIASAFHDSRFYNNKIKKEELPFLSFKVNFLNEPQEVYNKSMNIRPIDALINNKFLIGKHGITLYFNNGTSATYLASVLPKDLHINELTENNFEKLKKSLNEKANGDGNIAKMEIYECTELGENETMVLSGGCKYYLCI